MITFNKDHIRCSLKTFLKYTVPGIMKKHPNLNRTFKDVEVLKENVSQMSDRYR